MTAALEGGEWSAAHPGCTLPPGKNWYPFYRRLGGPHAWSGWTENLIPTGVRSRTVQPVVSHYTDWATGPTCNIYTYICTTYYLLFELTGWYRLRNILANKMKTLKLYTVNSLLEKFCIVLSSSSFIGTTAHCGLWPVKQYPSIFFYPSPTLSIFSLPALEDLFLLPLSILSRVFPFTSSLQFLEWRSFWVPYPPSFSPGDLTSLSFAHLSILLHFLLCSSLLVLSSSYFSIPCFHI